MSLRLRLLNHALRLIEKPALRRAKDPVKLRRSFERKAWLLFRAPPGVTRTKADIGPQGALVLTPDTPRPETPPVLYFHGGAYVFGSPRTHAGMLARLCTYTAGTAILPSYRLAPEHPYPAALDDALEAYRQILTSHGPPVIGGDSAGGGLALALLARILTEGLPPPRGCFALSPLTDLSFSGQSVVTNARAEAILPASRVGDMAQMYLGDADRRDPGASPLFAPFPKAPPVWLTVGDTEILLDDTRRMADHLRAQGTEVTKIIKPDHPHVWPIFQRGLPEARDTLRDVAQWIKALA